MVSLVVAALVAVFGFSMAADAKTKSDMPRVHAVGDAHTVNPQAFAGVLQMSVDRPVNT